MTKRPLQDRPSHGLQCPSQGILQPSLGILPPSHGVCHLSHGIYHPSQGIFRSSYGVYRGNNYRPTSRAPLTITITATYKASAAAAPRGPVALLRRLGPRRIRDRADKGPGEGCSRPCTTSESIS